MATGITLKGINRVTNNVIAMPPLTKPFRGLLSLETGPLNEVVIRNNIFLTSEADESFLGETRIHGTGRKARLADTESDSNIYDPILRNRLQQPGRSSYEGTFRR